MRPAGRRLCWLLLLLLAAGCIRSTPITNRKQFLLIPESQELALGKAAYDETLKDEKLSANPQYVAMVNRVGQRIAAATGENYDWEFRVIASDTQNAFCLPGGKVAVYEGILPICQNEAGLAVVMSHEIAHAVARHGGERMTQGYVVDGVRKAVAWVADDYDETNRQIIMRAYGLASEVGYILPYSRKHESEADAMGLVYMARAGYDPSEAPRFWERFAAATAGGEKPPEFLSTHPSDERRARDLTQQLDSALAVYGASAVKYGLGENILPPGSGTMLAGQNYPRQGVPARSASGPAGSPPIRPGALAPRAGAPPLGPMPDEGMAPSGTWQGAGLHAPAGGVPAAGLAPQGPSPVQPATWNPVAPHYPDKP
jgi:Zn-dependent protease with chaperone function